MASQPSTAAKYSADRPYRLPAGTTAHPGYLDWSRDPAVGLFVVLPLWLVYEVARYLYAPEERNQAEAYIATTLHRLHPLLLFVFRLGVAAAVLGAAWSILRRDIPWLRVGLVMILEGIVYALILGPVAKEMTRHAVPLHHAAASGGPSLATDLIGGIGAGIFEEITFRLLLLPLLAWFFLRACRSFALPQWIAVVLAILGSACLFSMFHYGPGDPDALTPWVFMYRTIAGILLGILFVLRGIGICVYTHAMYNVFLYLGRWSVG